MRYKLPSLLLLLLFFATRGDAQVNFGIKAGLNAVDVDPDDIRFFDDGGVERLRLRVAEANYGINIGVYMLAKTKRFFIQPEVIYNSANTDYQIDTLLMGLGFLEELFEERYRSLDIPIMMGLRFDFLRVGVGPVGHVHLSSTSQLLDIEGYAQDFENITYGFQAGLGIDFWSINLDLRYEGNFDKYGEHVTLFGEEYNFSDQPSRFIGTIGLSF